MLAILITTATANQENNEGQLASIMEIIQISQDNSSPRCVCFHQQMVSTSSVYGVWVEKR